MRSYLLKPFVLESSVGNIFGHLQSRLSLDSVLRFTALHLYVDITRYLSTCHCNRPEDGLTQTKEWQQTWVVTLERWIFRKGQPSAHVRVRATVEKEKFRNSGHRLLQHCSGARAGTRSLTQLFIVDNVRCSLLEPKILVLCIVWIVGDMNVFVGVQVAGVQCHSQMISNNLDF